MIEDFYIQTFMTDILYGQVKNAYKSMVKLKKLASKRKNKNRIYEGYEKLAEYIIEVLENRISIKKFKESIINLSDEYPEIFLKGREETGDRKKSAYSIIHKVEYAINRYDIEYPKYNMQRCDDL